LQLRSNLASERFHSRPINFASLVERHQQSLGSGLDALDRAPPGPLQRTLGVPPGAAIPADVGELPTLDASLAEELPSFEGHPMLDGAPSIAAPIRSAADLTRAAMDVVDGERPWMAHFYLGHGLGLESAEQPYVGTDLGVAYDSRLVLEAGTVVVIEPIVWDEGNQPAMRK